MNNKKLIKKLRSNIEKLVKENEFLSRGILSREKAYDFVLDSLTKQSELTQKLTILMLYMESLQHFLWNEHDENARVIKLAIAKFKKELIEGFGSAQLLPNHAS